MSRLRLNNEADPRTKRAFALTAIERAKSTGYFEDAMEAYERASAASRTRKGEGLWENALGALGIQYAWPGRILKNEVYTDSSSLFTAAQPDMMPIYEEAALRTRGIDIRIWPNQLLEDHLRFFKIKRGIEVQLSLDQTPEDDSASLQNLAIDHLDKGSELLEIIYDRSSPGTQNVGEFWAEVQRLHLAQAASNVLIAG